uniref:Uncharacterized protein n=1 Tax=uncultured marine group II/III euryarchaeote KM3_85_D04 TaxID=1456527 RepID=A0A075HZ74_9EURY|nr:hypothetical protein [uncultured marine group II/III euryarchaeote KM3_85_D04]
MFLLGIKLVILLISAVFSILSSLFSNGTKNKSLQRKESDNSQATTTNNTRVKPILRLRVWNYQSKGELVNAEIYLLHSLSYELLVMGELEEAIHVLKMSLNLSKRHHSNWEAEIASRMGLATAYLYAEKENEARIILDRALSIIKRKNKKLKSKNNKLIEHEVLLLLGVINANIRNQRLLKESLELAREIGNSRCEASSLIVLASYEDDPESIFHKTLSMSIDNGFWITQTLSLECLELIAVESNRLEDGLDFNRRRRILNSKGNQLEFDLLNLHNRAIRHALKGEHEISKKLFSQYHNKSDPITSPWGSSLWRETLDNYPLNLKSSEAKGMFTKYEKIWPLRVAVTKTPILPITGFPEVESLRESETAKKAAHLQTVVKREHVIMSDTCNECGTLGKKQCVIWLDGRGFCCSSCSNYSEFDLQKLR